MKNYNNGSRDFFLGTDLMLKMTMTNKFVSNKNLKFKMM